MKLRRLGGDGPLVGAVGLGCMPMSQHYGPPDEAGGIAACFRATASSEEVAAGKPAPDVYLEVARRLRVDPHECTAIEDSHNGIRSAKAAGMRCVAIPNAHFPPGEATAEADAVVASLAELRLGVETIDLYYLHRLDPAVPVEETIGAFAGLVESGKVRHIGLCEVGADVVRRAHAVHPLTAVQSEYSLWVRTVEGEVLPTLEELGIAFVAYSPLGRGFFAGALRSEADLAPDPGPLAAGVEPVHDHPA